MENNFYLMRIKFKTVLLTFLWIAILAAFSCKSENPRITIYTELGNIIVEIYPDEAPVTAGNFMEYIEDNKFENSNFYRTVRMDNQPENDILIEVIQGGLDFSYPERMTASIQHETTEQTGILHKDGVISMARWKPGTASAEFFICIGDQPELDFGGKRNPDGQGFAAFGKVVTGMEVVKRIQQMPDTLQIIKSPVSINKIAITGNMEINPS
jgi:peptidyl-prolyl cis-trans isomerase A (cyclophilin A)